MTEIRTFTFREGVLDIVVSAMRPIEVRDDAGDVIGRIVRGQLEGCEKSGTFRFEPGEGAATTLGVRKVTARSILGRLLRPTYVVEHEGQQWELKDLPGENIIYFAVAGDVDGHRLRIRQNWDDSVEVKTRREGAGRGDGSGGGSGDVRLARFETGEILARTTVEIDVSLLGAESDPRGTALFGTLLLLPFLHRIYSEESGIVEDVFFG